MGACATKPKVSKDEANAPATRELEPEATEKLIDGKQTETSATSGGEKDELATKEVEAKESDPPAEEEAVESAIEEDKKTPTTVESKEAEQVEESETTTAAKEGVKAEVAAAVSISLIEKSIQVVEPVKTEQAAEKSAAAEVAEEEEEEPKVQSSTALSMSRP